MSKLNVQVPRMIAYKVRVAAHLFSGQRRQYDLQHYLEKEAFVTISIDIIYHEKKGDLLRRQTLDFLLKALKAGWVQVIFAGPPCETWSLARYVKSLTTQTPRVLRTRQMPQGLPALTKREADQIRLGNGLLGVSLILLAQCLVCGEFMGLEHPAERQEMSHVASIWWLNVVRLLMRCSNSRRVRVLQGHYGGWSAKPTNFLFANSSVQVEEHF